MASSIQGLGLGINFDPPPSPPSSSSTTKTAAFNPAISRLQGQAALGKKASSPLTALLARRTASANDVDIRRQQDQEDEDDHEGIDYDEGLHRDDEYAQQQQYPHRQATARGGRKVRIVSAANTYHEQHYLSSGENSPALGTSEDATSPYSGISGYNDQDDILDDYAGSSPNLQHDHNQGPEEEHDDEMYEEQPSIIYPSLADPSPAPTMQTTLSGRSLGAVSSGSSTRYNDALSMAHPQHTTQAGPSDKVEEFEARLRRLSVHDDYTGYGAYHYSSEDDHHSLHQHQVSPARPWTHQRSYTVDETLPTSEAVATVRGNLPVSNSGSNLNRLPALRRVGAMSRPKSMMELNQLYNAGANIDVAELRQSFRSGGPLMQYQPAHHHQQPASAGMQHQLSVQTTTSSSAGKYSDTSPASVFTEEGGYASSAPSSVIGGSSVEPKPTAVFMGKQNSSGGQHQAPPMQTMSSNASSSGYSAYQPYRPQQPEGSGHQIRKTVSAVAMRSMASMRGLEEAETGGAAVVLDSLGKGFMQGVALDPRHAGQLSSPNIIFGSQELVQGGILMAHRSDDKPSTSGKNATEGRNRAASVATTKTASSSGHSAHSKTASSVMTNLPSTQGLPSLTGAAQTLQRQSTLISASGNPLKRAKELDRLLDPKPAQVRSQYSPTQQPYHSTDMPSRATFASNSTDEKGRQSGGTSFHPHGVGQSTHLQLKRKPSTVVLEQSAKGKARVELDLTLAGTMVVEGGKLKGRMEVRVRKEKAGEGEVWLGAVKARIVGFEELAGEDARHVFYHHSVCIEHLPSTSGDEKAPLPCYASKPDDEGFCKGKTGTHAFPFEMQLPTGKGAKGSWKGKAGIVKYIVIGSIKLKSHVGLDRSIAHFYRHVDVFPYLNPSIILAPAIKPLHAETSKAMFMGGSGKVHLKASLHRPTWVAGQRCYANIYVKNEAGKKIKTLTLSLIRTTTIFRPKPYLTAGNGFDENDPVYADVDQDACSTQTTKKKIAETSLEMGKKSAKGTVTAKGMWLGVDTNEETEFCHFLELPSDALTIERGRYLEISYALKVSVSGSLSSEVSVEIPCRIVNFVSIDPSPGHPGPMPTAEQASHKPVARAWSTDYLRHIAQSEQSGTPSSTAGTARSGVSRMTSMDSLNMADLNKMYSMQHGMPRQHSYGSQLSEASAPAQGAGMARSFTMPSGLQIIPEGKTESSIATPLSADLPGADPFVRRQLRHQMSLDCIGSAIASATARRAGHQRTNSGLSKGYIAEEQEAQRNTPPLPYMQEFSQPSNAVQLDDLDDIPDEYEELHQPQPGYLQAGQYSQPTHMDGTPFSYSEHIQLHDTDYAEYEDESEDEVDMVLQTKQYESEDDEQTQRVSMRAPLSPSTGYTRQASPVKSAMRNAPPKSPAAPRASITGRATPSEDAQGETRPSSALGASARLSFGVASPASPVKKSYTPITSPPRRTNRTLAPQAASSTSSRSPRVTPASPASGASARTTTSTTSTRRSKPSPNPESTTSAAIQGQASPVKRQQVERVPGPLSTPSVVRMQPLKAGMRKMASTSALRSSGM
ncbi:hypothetical protein P389DRAFT_95525 [Cystobasidium minutum MCA 4210]|uniref:uncharacterized protein n=1 Tax=Cystobasidium minutum MCA 4210 TaxID=1397322 RepID=UPI0034CE4235|eukprot:jgi/Rhomi1/95525/CE95524_1096